ncbi:enoyl-CoA hydratase/isomerase family protein [Roseivivax sp. CAU 1753]
MIRVQDEGALRIVTLDRADKANALTAEMLGALCEAVEDAGDARCLILTGVGKVFSAGADLDAAKAGLAVSPLWERLSGAIAALPALTIAALNGSAAGGALGMVIACDLRIAVPGARIFYPVMRLGFLPQPSDPARLRAIAGASRAKRILMAGERISTNEAERWGLVDHLVAPDALMDKARALAEAPLAAAPDHVAAIKALCARPLA